MTTVYEPQLQPVEIADLRPTQLTVGLLEVADKRQEWRRTAKKHG
ncbi:ParB-like protein, partial [Ensifer sp. SSB1]